ncbi:MAG TPA: GNAT family N-acetyltransferase [Candidatus Saccharimonadia bacterium]
MIITSSKSEITMNNFGIYRQVQGNPANSYADWLILDYNTFMTSTAAQLRRAQLRDIAPLRTLFVHALETDFDYFPHRYLRQVKRQHSVPRLVVSLLKKQRIILIAALDKRIVGYMVGSGHQDGVGELYWLYVHPSQRGQRVGTKLLQQAIGELRQQGMHTVRLMTHKFERYYKRYGFEVCGTYAIESLEVKIMQLRFEGSTHG